jgi:hypothetical protein
MMVQEQLEEAEEKGEELLDVWEEPEKLWTLVATDPEYERYESYRSLRRMGEKMRADLERTAAQNSDANLRMEAEKLGKSFSSSLDQVKGAFGIAAQVAAAREKNQDLQNRLKKEGQTIDTEISLSKSDAQIIKEQIESAGGQLDPKGISEAKSARSKFDILAGKAFQVSIKMISANFSKDFLFAGEQFSRIRNDGCKLVHAVDDYFEKRNIAFSDQDKNKTSKENENLLD